MEVWQTELAWKPSLGGRGILLDTVLKWWEGRWLSFSPAGRCGRTPAPSPQLLKGSFCLTSVADSCVWLCSSELRRVVLFKNQYELWRESSLLVAQCKDFIVSYSKEGNHRRQFQEIFQEFFFWGNTLHLTIGADEKKCTHWTFSK